jgi:hypothetical protein
VNETLHALCSLTSPTCADSADFRAEASQLLRQCGASPHREANCGPNQLPSWLRMAGHVLLRGLLHGIRPNCRVSSLRRCRKLRRRHPRRLRHRPIDRLGSLSQAATERPTSRSGRRRRPGAIQASLGHRSITSTVVYRRCSRLKMAGGSDFTWKNLTLRVVAPTEVKRAGPTTKVVEPVLVRL